MEKLTTLEIKDNLLELLIRVGDLSFFEGPLLSLYENAKTGHLYLLDWVDRDKTHNRWIIYRVDPIYLKRFLNKQISHLDLFKNRPKINVYVVDIPCNGRLLSSEIKELYNIPEIYKPTSDNFFDKEESVLYNRIEGKLNRILSLTKSQNDIKQEKLNPKKRRYSNHSSIIHSNIIQRSVSIFSYTRNSNTEDGDYNWDIVSGINRVKNIDSNYSVYNISTNFRHLNLIKQKNA